jgi:hypothetical protein
LTVSLVSKCFQISFIIYSRKIIRFGILKKIDLLAVFSYQDENRRQWHKNRLWVGLQNFVQTPSKIWAYFFQTHIFDYLHSKLQLHIFAPKVSGRILVLQDSPIRVKMIQKSTLGRPQFFFRRKKLLFNIFFFLKKTKKTQNFFFDKMLNFKSYLSFINFCRPSWKKIRNFRLKKKNLLQVVCLEKIK